MRGLRLKLLQGVYGYDVVRGAELRPTDQREYLRFHSVVEARAFLARLGASSVNESVLRTLVRDDPSVAAAQPTMEHARERVAELLASGRVRVLARHGRFSTASDVRREDVEETAPELVSEEAWSLSVMVHAPEPHSLEATFRTFDEPQDAYVLIATEDEPQDADSMIATEEEPHEAEAVLATEDEPQEAEAVSHTEDEPQEAEGVLVVEDESREAEAEVRLHPTG